ncbi:MAG: T9SS type A sorting domain-containing protein [Saprospiraceae bacterium]|nr:T9SS type A sorting domain-containing protein [Saprospiraceae bacterium]
MFFNQYRNISTGIDQIDKQLDIKIYPNPTKDFITISNAPADAMVQIFDVNGRLSLTKKLNSNHISLQNLGRGLYTLRIGSTEGIWIGKVIVN